MNRSPATNYMSFDIHPTGYKILLISYRLQGTYRHPTAMSKWLSKQIRDR